MRDCGGEFSGGDLLTTNCYQAEEALAVLWQADSFPLMTASDNAMTLICAAYCRTFTHENG